MQRSAWRGASRHSTCGPIVADFSVPWRCPADLRDRPRIGFFPGSTIGNLTPERGRASACASSALPWPRRPPDHRRRPEKGRSHDWCSPTTMPRASRRPSTSTCWRASIANWAAISILPRFRHEAIYNPRHGRIEMHLVSRTRQNVNDRRASAFRSGRARRIHTENSYKYSIDQFQELARCRRLATATRVDRRGQLVQRARARRRLGDRTHPKPCVRRALEASHAAPTARPGRPRRPPGALAGRVGHGAGAGLASVPIRLPGGLPAGTNARASNRGRG